MTGCWYWDGPRDPNGYGKVYWRGRKWGAHRVAYLLLRGDLGNQVVRHACDNPGCVNPDHLSIGTQGENVRDMVLRRRARGQSLTHCPAGHEYTSENTYVTPSRPHARYCRACHKRHSLAWWRRQRVSA